ncbi:hypothetical protein [Nocardioides sp. AX2bis]|uniref:hypothetical protein n=1 Tax=Nocardioides sp. AX2bis TaxID=2653157 RepID=UPI0012F1E0B2|nr:hypothetical protein [Nocardioides sp. AX2bis]VXC12612.1 membrane hypothetical protein [Nocardioides sp. AX2bis]
MSHPKKPVADPLDGRRGRIGDAPRWVVVPVLVVFVGLSLTFLVVVVGGGVLLTSTTGVQETRYDVLVGWVFSGVVVVVLMRLLHDYRRRRPLFQVDRAYYRLATFFIGIYGAMGSGRVGTVVAALMLLHSFVLDRQVRESPGPSPASKEHREWLERGGR